MYNRWFSLVFMMLSFSSLAQTQAYIDFLDFDREVRNSPEKYAGSQRFNALAEYYDQRFAIYLKESNLIKLSGDNILALYDATSAMAFYQPTDGYIRLVERIFLQLKQKDLLNVSHIKELQERYIASRMFGMARALLDQYPNHDLQPVPEIINSYEESVRDLNRIVWKVNEHSDSISSVAFPIPTDGRQIFVISHPGCAFSRQAVSDIMSDPDLSTIFSSHAIWLSPPDGKLNLSGYREWTMQHPDAELHWVNSKKEWPELQYWNTPHFYFFDNGKLIADFSGWPIDSGNKGMLLQALQTINLMREVR